MDQELAVVSSPPSDPYDDIPMAVDVAHIADAEWLQLLSGKPGGRSVDKGKGRESHPPPPLDRCVSPLTLPPSANALRPLSPTMLGPFNELAPDGSLAASK